MTLEARKTDAPVDIESLEKLLDQTHTPSLPHGGSIEKQLTDFLANISHEIKTPIALLKESISILADEITGRLTTKQKEHLGIAQQAVNRLTALVENLLDAARLTSGKITLHRTVTTVPELLLRCVDEFQPLARKRGLTIKATPSKISDTVYVDVHKIEQVLHNLVNNALRFAKRRIKLSTRQSEDKSFLEINVLDDGPGIPQKELRSIFQRFYQFGKTQPSQHKGLGLGLAIAKELVELHGGIVWAESIVGMGTRFAFTLPIFPSAFATLKEWLSKKAPLSGHDFQVLRKNGFIPLLVQMLESRAVDHEFKEQVLHAFHDRGILKGESPISLDHIEDFIESPLQGDHGHPLCALNMSEAFLMAHIEKNMGDYRYENVPIYDAGTTAESKRIALMKLVKSLGHRGVQKELEQLVRHTGTSAN